MTAMGFRPAELTVEPGDTIVWVNRDPVPHTATSEKDRWNTGALNRGDSGRLVARNPGAMSYICQLHPAMVGRIDVK
jgi:plastocyanin